MREGSGTELAQLVRDGSLDMLIAYDLALPPDLPRRQLFLAQPMVALAGSHRLADRQRIEPSELAEEPLVLAWSPDAEPTARAAATMALIRERLGQQKRIT